MFAYFNLTKFNFTFIFCCVNKSVDNPPNKRIRVHVGIMTDVAQGIIPHYENQ